MPAHISETDCATRQMSPLGQKGSIFNTRCGQITVLGEGRDGVIGVMGPA